jgi:hypothetical protein
MNKYKRGDTREDGMIFWAYQKASLNGERWITKNQYESYQEKIKTTISSKEGHLKRNLSVIKIRAKNQNLPFDLDFNYLLSIAPDVCPVFGFPLGWGIGNKNGYGGGRFDSPSLDKIVPELGYVKGNVMWVSQRANSMKHDATKEQLIQFANWILKTQ